MPTLEADSFLSSVLGSGGAMLLQHEQFDWLQTSSELHSLWVKTGSSSAASEHRMVRVP